MSAAVAGTARLLMDEAGFPVVSGEVENASSSIVLTAPYGETFEVGQWYYLTCLPGELEQGFTMTFRSETKTGVLTRNDPVMVKRSVWGRLEDADADVTYTEEENTIWDETRRYFTITSQADGNTISFTQLTNSNVPTIGGTFSYSLNQGATWTSIGAWEDLASFSHTLNNGETLSLKGDLDKTCFGYRITIPEAATVSGNIMSLVSGDGFADVTDLDTKSAFYELFQESAVTDASELILPATTLANDCYNRMFYDCTNLVSAPELPATTLADYCYRQMFLYCFNLTSAPELPATTLADYCYNYMFYGCTSLTSAPELPASSLANRCYDAMFGGCTSLTSAPELPATILKNGCYSAMFQDCKSLTSGPDLPATTLADYCYNYMFYGCTSLTSAPELPATALAYDCYESMFNGCTNLSYVKALFTTMPSGDYTRDWLAGVAATGTFVKSADATWDVVGPNGVPEGWTVLTDGEIPGGIETHRYFTITSQVDGNTISFTEVEYDWMPKASGSFFYSLDQGATWISIGAWEDLANFSHTLDNGETLSLKGDLDKTYFGYQIDIPEAATVSGNIMSLVSGDGFATKMKLNEKYAFYNILQNSAVTDASKLVLPATTLAWECYEGMFRGCTSLANVPELPSTTLASGCYTAMFEGCTSLTSAPELPATALAESCYSYMFSGCTSLTSAPELLATTLAHSCYSYMFRDCTSLTSAPELPATTMAIWCYGFMFSGCTSLTIAPELPSTNLASDCYNNMFAGCTNLMSAPALPATTMVGPGLCYFAMFRDCTSLTSAPELPATTLVLNCYGSMFSGCTSLTSAPELPATTLAEGCYYRMFYGCTSLTSAPELPATTLAKDCYESMFSGCTSLTSAPELPAATLAEHCYQYMFYGCTNLSYVKALFSKWLSNNTSYWLYGVAATGTFVKSANARLIGTGPDGVPVGWTVLTDGDVSGGTEGIGYDEW